MKKLIILAVMLMGFACEAQQSTIDANAAGQAFIGNGQSNVSLPKLSSFSMTLRPTNILYTGTTLASGTVNTRTITTVNSGFSNVLQGWDILLPNGGGATNEQYKVMDKVDNNTLKVMPNVGRTYTSVGYALYPSALDVTDITGVNNGSHLNNDGSLILNSLDTTTGNNGRVIWANRNNTFWIENNFAGGYAGTLCFYSLGSANGEDPLFMIDTQDSSSPYEAVRIRPDGACSFRIGLTNLDNGILKILSLSTFNKLPTFNHGTKSITNNLAAPATISLTGSPFSFTNTSAANGFVIIDGSVAFSATWNATTVQSSLAGGITIPLQPGEYTTVTYTVAPGMFFKNF